MTWYRGPVHLACLCLLTTLVVALGARKDACVDKSSRCWNWTCKHGNLRKWCPKTCGLCKPSSTPSLRTTHLFSTIKKPTTLDYTTAEKIQNSHSPTTLKPASTHSFTMARTSTEIISTVKIISQNTGCVDTRPECSYYGCKNDLIKKWCPKKCGLCTEPTSTVPPSTTPFPSTIKTPTTHDSTTGKISLTYSSTMATISVTTRQDLQTTMHNTVDRLRAVLLFPPDAVNECTLLGFLWMRVHRNPNSAHSFTELIRSRSYELLSGGKNRSGGKKPGTTSTEKRMTDKPITNQTSNEYSNAHTSYFKSGLGVAMGIGIAVSCLFVVAVVILLLIIKRRKKRDASLIHEPETIITMQPFSYTRDKPRDSSKNNAARNYKELHGNKGTCLASHKQQLTDDLNVNEPFYHVLEGNAPHQSSQNENLYACADYNSHVNKAFDLSGQTVPSQSRPEGERYEAITSPAVHKNKLKEEDNDCEDDFEKPYYHVLEKQNSKNQKDCNEAPLPVYQPLIGVRKDAMGNTAETCNEYQPLTDVRSKGARMS